MHRKINPNSGDFPKASLYASDLLARRGYSESGLLKKLQEKGFLPEVSKRVIQDFKSKKFLNDELLAGLMVENYLKYKPYGFFKIKHKLKEKGFHQNLIDQLLTSTLTLNQEIQVIYRILKRRGAPSEKTLPETKKLISSLANKGFRQEAILKALKHSSPEDA